MAFDLMPRSFWNLPSRLPSILDDTDDDWRSLLPSSGLTVSEDENKVYVEAAVPGIDPDHIEVTYDKGVLWIRGNEQEKEEDKNKKFYRRASTQFSYRVAIPGNIDENAEPDAVCKNGLMKVSFAKIPETQPKKLNIRKE
jgi:HSP20 family protein